MSLILFVIIIGIIQGFLLSFVLFTGKRGNMGANRYLGLLIFLFTASLGHVVIEQTQIYRQYPHVLLIIHPAQFLFGPVLLGYVTQLTNPQFRLKKKHLLHLIPFLLNAAYFTVTFYLKSGEYKIHRFESWRLTVTAADYFWSLAYVVFTMPYLVAGIKIVKQHQKRIKSSFSSIEKITLTWLQNLLYIIVSVFVVKTVFDILYLLDIGRYTGNSVMGGIIAVVIYIIGYMGWRQPEIFTGNAFSVAPEKYGSSALSPPEMQRYKKQLTDIMEKDKPFLNSSLTLKDLAGKMRIQSYRLSQVINQQFNQNFFDFVNYYRINEAKARLSDPKNAHLSILAIAYDVGFNSKSAFNTAFKKHTGVTPSRFRGKSV